MKLYIVRHGEAEPFNDDDVSRVLTHKGISDAYALGQYFINPVLPIDIAIVSSYRRAQQTYAEIAKNGLVQRMVVSDQITPLNSVQDALTLLHSFTHLSNILIVSHMPLVSALISTLVKGSEKSLMQFTMNTAGLAVIELDELLPATACLLAFLSPPYES